MEVRHIPGKVYTAADCVFRPKSTGEEIEQPTIEDLEELEQFLDNHLFKQKAVAVRLFNSGYSRQWADAGLFLDKVEIPEGLTPKQREAFRNGPPCFSSAMKIGLRERVRTNSPEWWCARSLRAARDPGVPGLMRSLGHSRHRAEGLPEVVVARAVQTSGGLHFIPRKVAVESHCSTKRATLHLSYLIS